MLSTIRTKVKEKLDTLAGSGKPFVSVFDYHTRENVGYPYASFEPTDFVAVVLDNCDNMRTYNFDVLVYQEITGEGRQVSLEILIKCIEDIINLLDKNRTLDGLCVAGCEPIATDFGTIVGGNGDTMFARVKIACRAIEDAK